MVCDINQIRQAFANAGCIEMVSCVDDCSMYFLNPQSMSGSQAQAFAQTLGANLVSVQSAAENQCIVNSLNDMNQSWCDLDRFQRRGNGRKLCVVRSIARGVYQLGGGRAQPVRRRRLYPNLCQRKAGMIYPAPQQRPIHH